MEHLYRYQVSHPTSKIFQDFLLGRAELALRGAVVFPLRCDCRVNEPIAVLRLQFYVIGNQLHWIVIKTRRNLAAQLADFSDRSVIPRFCHGSPSEQFQGCHERWHNRPLTFVGAAGIWAPNGAANFEACRHLLYQPRNAVCRQWRGLDNPRRTVGE